MFYPSKSISIGVDSSVPDITTGISYQIFKLVRLAVNYRYLNI